MPYQDVTKNEHEKFLEGMEADKGNSNRHTDQATCMVPLRTPTLSSRQVKMPTYSSVAIHNTGKLQFNQ